MSIVGYRPERQFYIDQIVKRCPEYLLLQRIKPGIYMENMSITTDLKILIYTVGIILQGRGK